MKSSLWGARTIKQGRPVTPMNDSVDSRPGRERAFQWRGDTEFRWSGQVMEPVDRLAFIGRNPGDQDIYVVTGDSGNGMTHGTIAGILLTDLILGKKNAWESLYDPSRVSLRASLVFAK